MVKFTTEQGTAYAAILQLTNLWARELDLNAGANVGDYVTEDCSYTVGEEKKGRAEVAKFYSDRLARLSASPEGVPMMRHAQTNLCVEFTSDTTASITFTMLFFTTASTGGKPLPDVAAVADVRMQVRSENGDWRICRFDSNQSFKRG
jgi:hypothetical protein